MKLARKLVGILLLAVTFGYPAMACVTSAEDMTATERECCQEMAQQCGSMDMPTSHSCCRTEVRQPQSMLLAAGTRVAPPVAVGAVIIVLLNSRRSEGEIALSLLHPPSESPPGSSSILRI